MARSGSNNIHAKLVLVGDMGSGKTSIVLRFVKGQYHDCQESTIGAAFFSQTISLNEGTIKFDIWDTAGQERYHSLAPMYYRGAAAAFVVYDISSTKQRKLLAFRASEEESSIYEYMQHDMLIVFKDSFVRAKKWVEELHRQGNPYLVMALVANKTDLETRRKISAQEGEIYAEENGLFFIEVSAKTAQNVNELFYETGKRVAHAHPSRKSGLHLHKGTENNGRRLFCCSA